MSTGTNIARLYEKYLIYPNVSIDSRSISLGTIFFALRGPNFNGNAFAEQALAQGAAYAVIDDAQYKQGERYILVGDTLKALQALANFHRRQLKIPIIAITGSYGKTTTKELIQAVLSQQYKSYATQGNRNNHIGVPLSLLAIDSSVKIAVIEMGANHIGEIAQLCTMAMPTHGLITNVGHVHLEGFGNLEGVIKGKSELYDYLLHHHGQVFINSAHAILNDMGQGFEVPILYPQQHDFYHCQFIQARPYVVYRSEKAQIITTQLLGEYNFYHIAAALCIGKYFGIDEHIANQAIQAYRPCNNRLQVIKKGSSIILLDAYNASLESVKSAIHAFQFIQATHKVLILGDMHELGKERIRFHQELVTLTNQIAYREVILYGPNLGMAKAANPQALHFLDKKALESYLKNSDLEDSAILIKGSRTLQLETLVPFINNTNN